MSLFHNIDLMKCEKPSRYIGGEINSVEKDLSTVSTRFCFAFPDIYEIGMSHLGLHILYQLLNEIPGVYCERAFMPWLDMLAQLKEKKMPLFTLETKTPLGEMDILGFTLQYELSYTNIVAMLELSGIQPLANERSIKDPLIIAGGPCAFNPQPLAEIIDIFFIGEAEESLPEFMACYEMYRHDREELLKQADQIEGLYVPSLYEPIQEHGILVGYRHLLTGKNNVRVKKRIIKDLDHCFQLSKPIVPFLDTVHDRATTEIFRGCTKGCRFCQAGMIYRPVREKSVHTITKNIATMIDHTGYDEISLTSLSTLDHSNIRPMIQELVTTYHPKSTSISLPSLRMDSASIEVLDELKQVRKTGLTFAPEAGTQRLRNVINKGINEDNIHHTLTSVFSKGWFRVKLYFMIGLPTEKEEDLEGIQKIADTAVYLFKKHKPEQVKKMAEVTVSASCFVPKPFTPFQWTPQHTIEEFYDKVNYLKEHTGNKRVKLNYHDPKTSYLEGVFARGDRALSKLLIAAYHEGCIFDGWKECFHYDKWMKAFEKMDINASYYTTRSRAYDEYLPWDMIDCGVSKSFLIREHQRSLMEEVTHDCRDGCEQCGMMSDIMTEGCPCLR